MRGDEKEPRKGEKNCGRKEGRKGCKRGRRESRNESRLGEKEG